MSSHTTIDVQDGINVNRTYNSNYNEQNKNIEIHNKIRSKLIANNKELESDIESIKQNGYVILRNVLSTEYLNKIETESNKLLSSIPFGRNQFEGYLTKRVYSIVSKSRIFDDLILNKRVQNICDYHLLPNYLLSVSQIIEIYPNQKQQEFHRDAGAYVYSQLPRIQHPWRLSTIWALDEFTNTNGSTVIIPKSHLWNNNRKINYKNDKQIKVIMNKGDCLLFTGTLIHCGGENKSFNTRKAITVQYCQPWLRVQENNMLSVPFDVVKMLPSTIKKMIGYSMHNAHGNFAGRHPSKAVDELLHRYSKL
eukprot:318033_1